jgi:hypothetical protein
LTFFPGARPTEYLWTIFSVRVCGLGTAALDEAGEGAAAAFSSWAWNASWRSRGVVV